MTHSDLVEIGYRWVMKRCAFAFKELKTVNGTGEIPDVIGFREEGSFLLEAKVSRSDFLCDVKKYCRVDSSRGMGDWRFFIAPAGMIQVWELPPMWGLIEVYQKGSAVCTWNPFTEHPKGNIYSNWKRHAKNYEAEVAMLKSALRRLQLKGAMPLIYEK
jgi:hypothetical protein